MSNKKTFYIIAGVFLLICAVSLYKQLSFKYLPNDFLRPYIVHGIYFLLLGGWLFSVRQRITQRSMARYLYLAGGFMLLWQFVRFLQEAYLYKNIHLLRVSGYFTVFPLIVTTLFDLYAALCLGNGESYSIPRSLFLLAIPDAFLVILELTNESHNMVFRVLPDEEENIEFHTNYGFVIILIFAAVLILSRIYIIYHKTRIIKQNRRLKIFPFMIGMAIPIVILPHLINQFVPGGEFIDFTAKLYFLEIMSWESCIIIGLIPINTRYGMVFEQSTIGMRIVDSELKTRIKSSHARELTSDELDRLRESGVFTDISGNEIHIHGITDGHLIYQKDVSRINRIIGELDQTASELRKENTLLSSELRSSSEKARITVQNQIYDRLTHEVGKQLSLIDSMIYDQKPADRNELIKKLCIVGTYVKRRCNLRIIEQQNGAIVSGELRLSLDDTVNTLKTVGIDASLDWQPQREFSDAFCLKVLDTIEAMLEERGFSIKSILIRVDNDASISLTDGNGKCCEKLLTDSDVVHRGDEYETK